MPKTYNLQKHRPEYKGRTEILKLTAKKTT